MNVGVEHQIVNNFAVGVSYHRRQHRQGLGLIDTARPAEAFAPEARTFTDPVSIRPRTITLYKLLPQFGTVQNRVITNVDVLESDYNGVTFDVQKKMSNRWQMLAGLTIQRHRGFDHSGTYTTSGSLPATACPMLNDPNCLINRDDGSVFTDVPWVFNLSGSYLLPWWDFAIAAKYNARDGDPLNRTNVFSFTNPTLTQPSATVRVATRGTDRTDTVDQFLDLRLSKRQRMGIANLELSLDMFNVHERQPRAAAERGAGYDLRPADPHPDAADHPAGGDAPVLVRCVRTPSRHGLFFPSVDPLLDGPKGTTKQAPPVRGGPA